MVLLSPFLESSSGVLSYLCQPSSARSSKQWLVSPFLLLIMFSNLRLISSQLPCCLQSTCLLEKMYLSFLWHLCFVVLTSYLSREISSFAFRLVPEHMLFLWIVSNLYFLTSLFHQLCLQLLDVLLFEFKILSSILRPPVVLDPPSCLSRQKSLLPAASLCFCSSEPAPGCP